MAEQIVNGKLSTLSTGVNASVGSVTLADVPPFSVTGQFRLVWATGEIMLATDVASHVYTVTRGVESTTAAAHIAGEQVEIAGLTAAALKAAFDPLGAAATQSLALTSSSVSPTDITLNTAAPLLVVNVTSDGTGTNQIVNLPNFGSYAPQYNGYRVTVVFATQTDPGDTIAVTTPISSGEEVYIYDFEGVEAARLHNSSGNGPANSAYLPNVPSDVGFIWQDGAWYADVANDDVGSDIVNSSLHVDGGTYPSTISSLSAASTLTGTEIVPVTQSGSTVRTTTQAIANLGVGGGAAWGSITGTLSDQTDLQAALGVAAGSSVWGNITGTLSDQADLQAALGAGFAPPVTVAVSTTIFQDGSGNPVMQYSTSDVDADGIIFGYAGAATHIFFGDGGGVALSASGVFADSGFITTLAPNQGGIWACNTGMSFASGAISIGNTNGTAAWIDSSGDCNINTLQMHQSGREAIETDGSFADGSNGEAGGNILLATSGNTGDTPQLINTAVVLIDYTTINSPAAGMIAYNFTLNKIVQFNGTTWETVAST